ncbi:MAG: hypothetical protein AAGC60_13060 [Acidobacteriota bacterium]
MVLDLLADQGFIQPGGVEEAKNGPHIDRLADSGSVERVQDPGHGGQSRGFDQQTIGAPLEEKHEGHLEQESSAAADTATRDLPDLHTGWLSRFGSRLHQRSVQPNQTVLVDEHGPPFVGGPVVE